MKKLTLLVGGIILSGVAMAQKPSSDVPMTLEGQLGFNASTLSFDAPAIRFRYFVTDNIAARVTFGINNVTDKVTVYEGPGIAEGATGEYQVMTNAWNAAIGGEYHFAGTDRLSPFVALDVRFGGGSRSFDGSNADAAILPDGTADITTAAYNDDYSEEGKVGFSNFGLALTGGVDYYFAENFYFGVELGFMWMMSKDKDASFSFRDGATTVTTDIPSSSSNSVLQTSATASGIPTGNFRLGWRF